MKFRRLRPKKFPGERTKQAPITALFRNTNTIPSDVDLVAFTRRACARVSDTLGVMRGGVLSARLNLPPLLFDGKLPGIVAQGAFYEPRFLPACWLTLSSLRLSLLGEDGCIEGQDLTN